MTKRIVSWGFKDDEKRFFGLALREEENEIDIYSFPAEIVTEAFSNLMKNEWSAGKEAAFPEGFEHICHPFTEADNLMPQNMSINKFTMQDTQNEWHFILLSAKLKRNFINELEGIEEKINNRTEENAQEVWQELKKFWGTLEKSLHDRVLWKDHAASLRKKVNALFSELKKIREKIVSEELERANKIKSEFFERIEDINKKFEGGLAVGPLFSELIKAQKDFKATKIPFQLRSPVYKKFEELFQKLRGKSNAQGVEGKSDRLQRLKNRINGLHSSIGRIQKSLQYEDRNLQFENKRIAKTESQLEAQIREAKIKMIETRKQSKRGETENPFR